MVAGSTSGQWVVTYQVTAANGTGTEVSYSLHDQLGFPAGVTVTSTSASRVHSALDGSGATASEPIPGWTGTGSGTALASNQVLAAQSKDTFTIVVGATVTSSLAAAATACNATGAGTRLLQLCRPDFRLRPVQRPGVRSDHASPEPGFLTQSPDGSKRTQFPIASKLFRAAAYDRPGAEPRAPVRGRSVGHGYCSRTRIEA